MSLSFVSSAVLSSTDGVSHNEEKSIESKEVTALRSKQEHKPLFEQLRNNREEEDAAREEFQRTMMRGTRALDEEDCAHLDAIQREKDKREQAVKSQESEELALFRAAKADRAQGDLVLDDDDGDTKETQQEEGVQKKPAAEQPKKGPLVPVIRKRRRRQPAEDDEPPKRKRPETMTNTSSEKANEQPATLSKKGGEGATGEGLSSLLGAYGSSDEESE